MRLTEPTAHPTFPAEPPPSARYRNHRMVRLNVRECAGFEKANEPHDPPFRVVNEHVWVSQDELEYLRFLRSRRQQVDRMDIADLNLACAVELPGSEGLAVNDLCRQLDEWAEHVRRETERSRGHFLSYPEEYTRGEPEWRMLVLTDVLQKHYGVRYNPGQATDYTWGDSRDQFIHGLLGPNRTGTCVSLPVLLVAIGRRLGYPLWLCEAPGHVFTRWADRKTGFTMNVECHGKGMTVRPDDFYRRWPVVWDEATYEAERKLGPYHRYLRPLEPWETMACFLVQRGHVWEAHDRWGEAVAAYNAACDFVPYNKVYSYYASEAWRKMVDPNYQPDERIKWKGVTINTAAAEAD